MSATTGIEWTDATWNPVTGCESVSAGCDHCYARTFAERFRDVPGHHFEHGFEVTLRPNKLWLPMSWRRPRRVFVNSMSDLFHADVPDTYIAQVFAVMALAHWHTFQVLTKRPARMRALLSHRQFRARVLEEITTTFGGPGTDPGWPLPNVWLGVSTEDQRWADLRIPILLDTPAAVRFVSAEPLLGPIELAHAVIPMGSQRGHGLTASFVHCGGCCERFHGIDWVIAGGESGPGARPIDPGWVRSLRDQCQPGGVAFTFKQWGAWIPDGFGLGSFRPPQQLVGPPVDERGFRQVMRRVGKGRAGRVLDGQTWTQFPNRPGVTG